MFKNRRLPLALFTLFVIAWIKSVWSGENILFMTLALISLSCVGVCLVIVEVLRARSKRGVWLAMVVTMTCVCTAVGVFVGQPWMGLVVGIIVSVILTSMVIGTVQGLDGKEPPSTQIDDDEGAEAHPSEQEPAIAA